MKTRTKLLPFLNQHVTFGKMPQTIFTFFFLGACMIAVTGMQIPPSADVTSARLTPQSQQQEIGVTPANDVMSDDFCTGLSEGSYCQNCMMPITCNADGAPIEYGPCPVGQACIVDHGTSYCTEHTATACACPSPGNQCDAYNPSYVELCGATGPFQVTLCDTGMTCYQGECHALTECTLNEWNLVKPKCSSSVYCDATGILNEVSCGDGYYVDPNLGCSPAPPPDCDGTCGGKCPNPLDCSKYVICDGTTATGKGDCQNGMLFDTVTKNCMAKENDPTCVATDNCEFTTTPVIPDSSTTTTTSTTTTPTTTPTTTTTTATTTTTSTTPTSTTTTTPTTTTTSTPRTTTTTTPRTTTTTTPSSTTTTTTTTPPTTTTTSSTSTTTAPTTTTTSSTTTTPTTTSTTSTTSTTTSTTTTAKPAPPCDELHVADKYPVADCSQMYWTCVDFGHGDYRFLQNRCLGDLYFDTDPYNPYCMAFDTIDSCVSQW